MDSLKDLGAGRLDGRQVTLAPRAAGKGSPVPGSESAPLRGHPALRFGEPLLVFLLAILVRRVGLSAQPPHADDLYHFYAARSYLADGSFSIFSGSYERAKDFTWLVATSMRFFGETLEAARLPSLMASAILVAAVYVWMRREAGRGPALIAAGMLTLLRPVMDTSTLIRFYAIQSLLFWMGGALIYRVLVTGRANLAALVALAVAGLALAEAARLQFVSLIGLVGLAAWAAGFLTWRLRRSVSARVLAAAWVSALAAGAVLLLLLVKLGVASHLLEIYRSAAVWALENRDNYLFYYHTLAVNFGLLVDFLPLATLAAVVFFPRPALLCASLLFFGLILHSFGGMKDERYIAYLLPYFACLWGLAAWPLVAGLRDRVAAFGREVLGQGRWDRAMPGIATALVAVLGAALVMKAVPVLDGTVKEFVRANYHRPTLEREWSWRTNRQALRHLAGQSEVFIVDDDLSADLNVARADIVLNISRLQENRPPEEFVRDFRTGTPTISSADSIRAVVACFSSGAIVSTEWFLSWLDADARGVLAEHERVAMPAPPLVAYVWHTPGGAADARAGQDCGRIRQLVAATAAGRRSALTAESRR